MNHRGPQSSHLDGVQGADEGRTEPYTKYGERTLETATQQSAKSDGRVGGSAGKQAGTVRVFGLIDCNNFFVSCERIFRLDLEGKPVVVLSSNDGCAVARSNEAKALGIPMGGPAFKYRQLFKDKGVVQFSANFDLYGDISSRITAILTAVTPHIEVYSVDESFLDLSELKITDYIAWGREIRDRVWQEVGVPVSIGIAPSKTLAKLASERAKKVPELDGVLSLINTDSTPHLHATPIKDIWGVGWRLAPKLKAEGVHTAYDLAQLPLKQAQKLMGIHGQQMVSELNGQSCLPLQREAKPHQTIMHGRLFGEDTSELHVVEASVVSLTARAAFRLRREALLTTSAAIFLATNRHKPGYARFSRFITFSAPTADTGRISSALVQALGEMYYPTAAYHRADILLYNLVPEHAVQTDLFGEVNPQLLNASHARLKAVDQLNQRFGKGSVRYAAEDLSQKWQPKHSLRSPRYTTHWAELPEVYPKP